MIQIQKFQKDQQSFSARPPLNHTHAKACSHFFQAGSLMMTELLSRYPSRMNERRGATLALSPRPRCSTQRRYF